MVHGGFDSQGGIQVLDTQDMTLVATSASGGVRSASHNTACAVSM
jgi:hypothetical protein